jgi:uncharacterized protein
MACTPARTTAVCTPRPARIGGLCRPSATWFRMLLGAPIATVRLIAEITDLSEQVVDIETEWIPLRDGRRLAARRFMPRVPAVPAVPAVIEYIPYRRRDGTRIGDEMMHRWFAAHGLASLRIDIAGTGDSDGLLDDEYVAREQDDAVEVIEWLSAQPWCTGSVGMIGISWGGFNSLQVAARRPTGLKAIITVCSTVDRYACDAHYTGGCLNEENLEWGGWLWLIHALPPDPGVVGERWREMWRARIEAATLPPAEWLRHQRRDDFWRHGSVCEDYSAIDAAVLAVGGWADGYTQAVFALVDNVPSAVGIVGPWGHKYPHDGVPGPSIDFLGEATRWWNRWLGPATNHGYDTEGGEARDLPKLRAYVQQPLVPAPHHPHRPGEWVTFDLRPIDLPRRQVEVGGWTPVGHAAVTSSIAPSITSPVTVGLGGGQWCPYGQGTIAPELPVDQRADDAGSLCWDSPLVTHAERLLGVPRVGLRVRVDQPVAMVAVRLCDVHPDGTVERLSYGVLNLCHRNSHAVPEPMPIDEQVDVVVTMEPLGHELRAGHRLRLSVSTAYWPMIWPSPQLVSLRVDPDSSWVDLPTVPDDAWQPATFAAARAAQPGPATVFRPAGEQRSHSYDYATRTTTSTSVRDDGEYRLDDIGTTLTLTRTRRNTIVDDQPLSAVSTVDFTATYRRGEWDAVIEATVEQRCDADDFFVVGTLTTRDSGDVFAQRRVEQRVPRDHL